MAIRDVHVYFTVMLNYNNLTVWHHFSYIQCVLWPPTICIYLAQRHYTLRKEVDYYIPPGAINIILRRCGRCVSCLLLHITYSCLQCFPYAFLFCPMGLVLETETVATEAAAGNHYSQSQQKFHSSKMPLNK